MTACVVLNPYSGRGRAARARPRVEAALRDAGVEYELRITEGPLHAIELAQSAVEAGVSQLVAAGGDGLISEVINGAQRAEGPGPKPPLAVFPLGTANDLASNLDLPKSPHDVAQAIAEGPTRTIDLGKVNGWYFANNSAVGLEPLVTQYSIEMVRLRGVIRYFIAALRAIAAGRSYQMQLRWDQGQYEGPLTLVSVGNNPVTGGLFRMTPGADPADGLLTFVYGFAPTRRKLLALLPRTLNGSHVHDAAIHQQHTRRLRIRAGTPTALQVDGELRGSALSQINYEVLPRQLELRILPGTEQRHDP